VLQAEFSVDPRRGYMTRPTDFSSGKTKKKKKILLVVSLKGLVAKTN
jgi:hypothetical protein